MILYSSQDALLHLHTLILRLFRLCRAAHTFNKSFRVGGKRAQDTWTLALPSQYLYSPAVFFAFYLKLEVGTRPRATRVSSLHCRSSPKQKTWPDGRSRRPQTHSRGKGKSNQMARWPGGQRQGNLNSRQTSHKNGRSEPYGPLVCPV